MRKISYIENRKYNQEATSNRSKFSKTIQKKMQNNTNIYMCARARAHIKNRPNNEIPECNKYFI